MEEFYHHSNWNTAFYPASEPHLRRGARFTQIFATIVANRVQIIIQIVEKRNILP